MHFSISITFTFLLHLCSFALVGFAIYQGFFQEQWLRSILDVLLAMYFRDLAKCGGFAGVSK